MVIPHPKKAPCRHLRQKQSVLRACRKISLNQHQIMLNHNVHSRRVLDLCPGMLPKALNSSTQQRSCSTGRMHCCRVHTPQCKERSLFHCAILDPGWSWLARRDEHCTGGTNMKWTVDSLLRRRLQGIAEEQSKTKPQDRQVTGGKQ